MLNIYTLTEFVAIQPVNTTANPANVTTKASLTRLSGKLRIYMLGLQFFPKHYQFALGVHFYISGFRYTFVSRKKACAHKYEKYTSLYNCHPIIGNPNEAKCEQHCSNWNPCIAYSITRLSFGYIKCQLYPSYAASCPYDFQNVNPKGSIALTKDDLAPHRHDSGYCKYKQGMKWQNL